MATTIPPIALIFGAGARVGAAATSTFLAADYRVARISRSQDPSQDTANVLNIPADLSRPETIEQIVNAVRDKWGEPSVVVWNAAGSHQTDMSKPLNTFNIPTDIFAEKQALNVISPFVAMREALDSFRSSSTPQVPKTFLFTGNTLNQGAWFPGFLALGTGKAGAAFMIEAADAIYSTLEGTDIRFHYVDERHEDGTPLFTGLGGQGHADAFLGLAERKAGWKEQGWLVTFVSGNAETGTETKPKAFRSGLILPKGM